MKHRATKRMLSGCLSAALVLQIAATVPALAVDAENNQGFSVDSLTLQPGETQSQINLNWYAPEGTTSAQVRFGDQVFTASVGALTAPTKLDEGKYTDTGKLVCKATVYDLSPDTEYQYAVSYDGGATWSQEYTYQTADDDSFTFAFTSDPQIKEDPVSYTHLTLPTIRLV